MLTPVEKILFVLAAALSLWLAQQTFRRAFAVIRRGEGTLTLSDLPRRVWRALDVSITQRTVLRDRPITSLLHSFIAWGFIFYVLVNLGDVIEGYFAVQFLGSGPSVTYRLLADVFSVLALAGMAYFLLRRLWPTPRPALSRRVLLHERAGRAAPDSLIVGLFILTHIGALPGRVVLWRCTAGAIAARSPAPLPGCGAA